MTQDKFVQLMVESGLARYVQVEKTCVSNALQRFAALVAAHEREQIKYEHVATIGNWGSVEWNKGVFPQFGDKMYAAIRARSTPRGEK